ncbi:MAG: zinc dependent phospholipase C family protein [Thermomicrobiales bacterium]|nr:zinc dependent phospholipase C family protein [Thermomicrobiales bacterium]
MPGSMVHLIVQQRMSAMLRQIDPAGSQLADLLDKDSCSPYTAFGSMGPDFLFFSLVEYGTPLDELLNLVFDVYDKLEPFITFYEDTVAPIEQAIDDAVAFLDQLLLEGLLKQISDTVALLSSTALNAVGNIATQHIDLFYPFYPKIQQGEPEKNWYWIDMLHYRRTGQFANELWNLADNDDLRRYALGYISHIATDVVGHPFVNNIVGGPFRTHWHRHKLVENWIDAYARKRYQDNAQTFACLKITPDDQYRADAISSSHWHRLMDFGNQAMPNDLAEMFSKAMHNVFHDIDHPPFLSPDDVDTTYRLFMKYFVRVTGGGAMLKPTPVPPPGSAAAGLINDFVSGFPSPPSVPSPGGGFNPLAILAALFEFAKWLVESAIYVGQWLVDHAGDILTLPHTEALALLKWLIYQLQKALFEIYENLRFYMVLGAYFLPEPQDLAKHPWGLALVNSAFTHLTGGAGAQFSIYPRKQEQHDLFGTTEHHLVYPNVIQEDHYAEPAPIPFLRAFPEGFIDQPYDYDPFIETLFDAKGPYNPNPNSGLDFAFTHDIDQQTWKTAQLGNAVEFTARLIAQRVGNVPNLNLDGDRGYGWKTWRAHDPANIETNNPVDVDYIDL